MKNLKSHYKIFFSVLIVFISLVILANLNFGDDQKIIWGATFSKKQCQELGLDWRKVYGKILDEMNFKVLRIPVYWDEVEKAEGKYDFSDYDWIINKAQEKNVEIVPVFGRRVPRWPECHVPKIYKNYSEIELQNRILILLENEVNHFKNYKNIKKWQISNEPFVNFFGQCPPADNNLVEREIKLVKSLSSKPIVITESGELSTWLPGAKLTDILGFSMYRQTWNKKWGYFYYPLLPAYYYFKAQLIKKVTNVKEVINTELQVEPWTKSNELKNMDLFDQFYSMDLQQVKTNIDFARKSGINEIYLWGVEWWYWLKEKQNHPEFWEYGKTLINAGI